MAGQMVFYFSGTGNSLYVARRLDDTPLSIPQEMRKAERSYAAEAIGVVSPVYYGEIPGYVQNFLKSSRFDTPYFFFVLTYGSSPMIAPEFAADFAKREGITVHFVTTILMVDNYLPYFDMDVEKGLDKHVETQIETALREIGARRTGIPAPTGEQRQWYARVSAFNRENPAFNSGSQLTITERCVGCGTCTRVCPQGNCILREDKALRKRETCEFCLACIQNCPVNAIALSVEDKNPRARYRNPHVSVRELEAANCQICPEAHSEAR